MLRILIAIGIAVTVGSGAIAQSKLPYQGGELQDLWESLSHGSASGERLQRYRLEAQGGLRSSDERKVRQAHTRLVVLFLADDEDDTNTAQEAMRHVDYLEATSRDFEKRNAKYLRLLVQLKLARAPSAFTLLRSMVREGTDAEQLAARRTLALVSGWYPSEVSSAELARLITTIGPIGRDFMLFPAAREWEVPALGFHLLASQRYRSAWSDLGSTLLEQAVEAQHLSQLQTVVERGVDPAVIRQRAYAAFDFYDLHYRSSEGWELLSSVVQRWPPPPDEQSLVQARRARALLASGSEAAALQEVRKAISTIQGLRNYALSWRLSSMKDLSRRVETAANPVLAIEVQRTLIERIDAFAAADARVKERFEATLELVRLQGLTGEFLRIAEATENAKNVVKELDRQTSLSGGGRLFAQRLRLAEIQALDLVPSRTENADAMMRNLLEELEQIAPIQKRSAKSFWASIEEAKEAGNARNLEDYLQRQAAIDIQVDALATQGFLYLRREEFAAASTSLEQALEADLHKNGVCGSATQLEIWRGLALASAALNKADSARGWFGEWANCSSHQGRESRTFAEALIAYGRTLARSRDWVAAEYVLQRGLHILSSTSSEHALALVSVRLGLAELALAQGRESELVQQVGQATSTLLAHSGSGVEWKVHGRHALALLTTVALQGPDEKSKTLDLAFALGQKISNSHASAGLLAFSYRASLNDARLAGLVQRSLELQRRRDVIDARLQALYSSTPISQNLRAREELTRELSALEEQLGRQAASLAEFPSYQSLVVGRPVTLAEFLRPSQAGWILAPEESLVVYMQATESLFAIVISRTQARLVRLDARVTTVSRLVERIRRSTKFAPDGRLPAFDLAAAQELHERIWRPVSDALGPVVKVTIVTDGPLASIPFELLPVGQSGSPAKPRWLDDEIDVRYVPSVSSMTALQKVHPHPEMQPRKAAIIFGPPSLPTPIGGTKPSKGSFSAYLSSARMGDELSPTVLCEGKLSPFPPSVTGMARDLADALGAGPDDTLVHDRMAKSQLQRLNAVGALSRYANLAFVTHGLVAGQLVANANTEPALVFTPTVGCQDPKIASTALLTASEVAELRLNADLVMLLACDTAAADGTPGAEPLSGLARAFMFAGARGLLISHWSVSADATSRLMQNFAQERRTASRSSLFRGARSRLRADPNFSHPAFWAGFSIVGAD
ncbi:hypothetical protein MASR2M32_28430 [Sphaerotilus sulfidivorans]